MEKIKENPVNYIIGVVVVIAGLYFTKRVNYLLFHSLAELFSIVIAITLFLIMWNSKKYMVNKVLVFISIGYLFVAIIFYIPLRIRVCLFLKTTTFMPINYGLQPDIWKA